MAVEYLADDAILELRSEPLGRIIIEGERNRLRVGENVILNASIIMQGSGGLIEIEDDCQLAGTIHIVRGEGAIIRIGQTTTFNAVALTMHESGEIVIGKDCLFSTDIHMDVSDMHPIYDGDTCERINPARSIQIGDHVWLGRGAMVLKGARIGSGSVIAAGAMVVGEVPANVIALGSPARVVREHILWSRNFDDEVRPLYRPPVIRPPHLHQRAYALARRVVKAGLRRISATIAPS
jgi:acetyltransferase-like isoleucine patch superfamily enzyme